MPQPSTQIWSLPTEILYTILKAVLDEIVQRDMMISPKPKHEVLPGGLPFPHTMALVCRYWRDIVFSSPRLWTRIFCVVPKLDSEQILSSQLEKTGVHPFDLTIVSSLNHPTLTTVLRCVEPHMRRIRSLRMLNIKFVDSDKTSLPVYAPWLECLRLGHVRDTRRLLQIDCPSLRILRLNRGLCDTVEPQWAKNNLTRVESVEISYGRQHIDLVLQVLVSIPQRIPCLTLQFISPDSHCHISNSPSMKIAAHKVILWGHAAPLSVIDDHCKTIVLLGCDIVQETNLMPPSSTLEFDRCFVGPDWKLGCRWNGDTVIIRNCGYSCIETILCCLYVILEDSKEHNLWTSVTALILEAKDDFSMNLPVLLLKDVVNSRLMSEEDTEHKKRLNDYRKLADVQPIKRLIIHGGPPLLCNQKSWFEEHVQDFEWTTGKIGVARSV